MTEVWKDIPGFEGEYQASSLGRIRRIKTTLLKPRIKNSGYAYVAAKIPGTERLKYLHVHRAILASFSGEFKSLHVNHKNFNKLDNSLDNLEWVTRSNNTRHAVKGGKHNKVKLTPKDVLKIRDRLKSGESSSVLAKEYAVHYSAINNIKKHKTWEYV